MSRRISEDDFVFIQCEQVFGQVISRGTYVSRVKYSIGGIEFDVVMENEELIPFNEVSIPFDEGN